MHPRPFDPDSPLLSPLFAHPAAMTPGFHRQRARELTEQAAGLANAATARAILQVAGRHRATAEALSARAAAPAPAPARLKTRSMLRLPRRRGRQLVRV